MSFLFKSSVRIELLNLSKSSRRPAMNYSSNDLQQTETTSVILQISTDNITYKTTNLPAFWMIPGQCEQGCGCAINTVNVSNFTIVKTGQQCQVFESK